MATEILHDDTLKVIAISPKETADLIGLLAAQLANVPLVGTNGHGAVPSINIVEHGVIKYRLALCLDKT